MITLASAVIEYYLPKLLINTILKIIEKLYKKKSKELIKQHLCSKLSAMICLSKKKWKESVSVFSSVDNKY
jgi:hypothetical protein